MVIKNSNGTKPISNGIIVRAANLVILSGYSWQDTGFILGLNRIKEKGLCIVLNHNQLFCADNLGKFHRFKGRNYLRCCGGPENEDPLIMFDNAIGNKGNSSKIHEDCHFKLFASC